MSKRDSKKQFTFISRAAPYGGNRPQLCLDMALAASVFEQQVNYLFVGDGVYQLLKGQNAEAIHTKTLGNAMATLDLYGIDNVIVQAEALVTRGLTSEDLLLPVLVLSGSDISALIARSDAVFNL